MAKSYMVNEIFYSLQGEGMRAGTANFFVRMSGCNRKCTVEESDDSPGGFDCDTEFVSGRGMTAEEIVVFCEHIEPNCQWIILTGGEPGLQVDKELIDALHAAKYKLAIETNGSIALPDGLDWICVSPKVAEHAVRQLMADEVKYVRGLGQGIPKPVCKADYHLISPAFDGGDLDPEVLSWCIKLVKENPSWRLSVQQHQLLKVR